MAVYPLFPPETAGCLSPEPRHCIKITFCRLMFAIVIKPFLQHIGLNSLWLPYVVSLGENRGQVTVQGHFQYGGIQGIVPWPNVWHAFSRLPIDPMGCVPSWVSALCVFSGEGLVGW